MSVAKLTEWRERALLARRQPGRNASATIARMNRPTEIQGGRDHHGNELLSAKIAAMEAKAPWPEGVER